MVEAQAPKRVALQFVAAEPPVTWDHGKLGAGVRAAAATLRDGTRCRSLRIDGSERRRQAARSGEPPFEFRLAAVAPP